ncbi:hypothetical protein BDY19DRAFT_955316 [Irpex rosettiformis]|uniref:Uncharacterized protein n=1 Tax=Irpex rosettiformis TaxID=378272 RepID=A0ACB8TZ46_9APHY|nr:hypothetical protein BDY19DRAFT_955316 [Irpex rosettiformis]
MNNPKSTVLGWGSLIAAAGVSYYFAKKSINERRAEQDAKGTRPKEKLDWKQKIEKDSQAQTSGETSKEKTGDVSPRAKVAEPPTDESHGKAG